MFKIDNSYVKQWKNSRMGFIPFSINLNCSFCGERCVFSMESYGRSEGSVVGAAHCPSCNKVMRFITLDPAREEDEKHQHGGIYAYPPPNVKTMMPDALEMPEWLFAAYGDTIKAFNASILSSASISCHRLFEEICRDKLPKNNVWKNLDTMLFNLPSQVDLKETFTELTENMRLDSNIRSNETNNNFNVSRDEAALLIEFMECLTEYLYILPAKIKKMKRMSDQLQKVRSEGQGSKVGDKPVAKPMMPLRRTTPRH